MANHTLLDCVNETLKRVKVLDTANTGLLASLTSSSIQDAIDIAVQVINEGIDELYNQAEVDLPLQGGETTFTLVTGTREYAPPGPMVKLLWPMTDRVNTQYIVQWLGSYEEFLLLDPQQTFTGLPTWGMISPITGQLRLDRAPDPGSNGKTYTVEYHKDTVLALATDTVPFNNLVFRSMVPAWVQLWKREMRNEFDQSLYATALGRASRTLTQEPLKKDYNPRGYAY